MGMSLRIGIDVGGTFTDFIVSGDGHETLIHKVLSTPDDPSLAVLAGLEEVASMLMPHADFRKFVASIDAIVHGTTVATNTTLTHTGARSALLTTSGVRDALEMRRGIRERQYDNRYTNVKPLVPRYLRVGVGGRLDRNGVEIEALSLEDIRRAIAMFKSEKIEAVSICFMNAFANPAHERAAEELVRKELPEAYLTVSTKLMPTIRFYERVSTTVLNSYVGPRLNHYLYRLVTTLKEAGFDGVLLIMQSNGGVMSPQVAREKAALTLLSGPAGGPGAGLFYARALGTDRCITTDMGGTSFEASVAIGTPATITDGEIARHKIALPMLDIHTIGAGGGSIAWLDDGGLLRMGPQSAGAAPGPACYGKGGTLPTTTDANLVLGYLDPDYFAGAKMQLDTAAARRAIETNIAMPMGLTIEAAAAGMYRVACNNMAQGVREVTIKRGYDPFGMLLSELKHDFLRTFVARLDTLDWKRLVTVLDEMQREGEQVLAEEHIAASQRRCSVQFDCRYLKQYHEVSFDVPLQAIERRDTATIARSFHAAHNRLYGYTLEAEGTSIELINVRLQAVGVTKKRDHAEIPYHRADASHATKLQRRIYIPETNTYQTAQIYDGHRLRHGNRIAGPALIETATTAVFVSASYDCVVDRYGSFVLYRKGREDLIQSCLGRVEAEILA
jgi:N-methylhydantoinase A